MVITMKTLKQSFFAKLLAIVLLCGMVLGFAASAGAALYLYENGAYTKGLDAAARDMLDGLGQNLSREAARSVQRGVYEGSAVPANFRCVITDAEGETLYSDYENEDALWDAVVIAVPDYASWSETRGGDAKTEDAIEPQPSEEPEEEVTPTPRPTTAPVTPKSTETKTVYLLQVYNEDNSERYEFDTPAERSDWISAHSYRVHGYILRELREGDAVWEQMHWFSRLYAHRTLWPALAVGTLLCGVLLFIFLLAAAGWHRGEDKPRESFADRIPFDLFTLLIIGAETVVLSGVFGPGWDFDALGVTAVALLGVLAGLIFLLWCMSFAVRVKCGTVWRNNLIARIWRWLVAVLKKLCALAYQGLKALPLMGRWAAILGGLLLVEFLLTAVGGAWLLFILHLFVLCPAALYLVWQLRKLRLAAHELAQGNLDAAVDTKGMFLELKEHAEDLNAIRDGVNTAVEERMKSERFRTELITNVSHDIKTPLTSIVSYVDLLEKEELENETAKGYVEVLSRQSAKLKKLIEDLLEASKASTGNLPVNWETLEFGVLVDQSAGEYQERLEQAGLTLLTSKPDRSVTVRADGRHMWRIFDNLMGNIVKYAQPGTRVYLDLAERAGKAEVTFRNISRDRLNVSGEELAERFVRGDASRGSEGSGLGLSIAASLAALQKGELRIEVDGDLFKATLRFDCINE